MENVLYNCIFYNCADIYYQYNQSDREQDYKQELYRITHCV